MDMAADDRIVGVAEKRGRIGAWLLEGRIPPERVGDLHRLALIGRVVEVHRRRTVFHVAVVAPDQHFLPINVPCVSPVNGVEIRPRPLGINRRMRPVVSAAAILDDQLSNRPEIVATHIDLPQRGEHDIPALENTAEHDVLGTGERDRVRPGLAAVLGEQDLPIAESEGLVIALRVDVWAVGPSEAIDEVVGFGDAVRRGKQGGAGEQDRPSGGGGRGEKLAAGEGVVVHCSGVRSGR